MSIVSHTNHPLYGVFETLITRNLFEITNFCATNSEEFVCIQKSSTNQTTPFKVWWCIDFLIYYKNNLAPVEIKNAAIVIIKECFMPALTEPSESFPIASPLKNP